MPRTLLSVQATPGYYALASSALTFTAIDVANGNAFIATKGELIVVKNTDPTTSRTLTISSVPDPGNRTGDIVEVIPAGQWRVYGLFGHQGWLQADGRIWLSGENAVLQVAIVKPSEQAPAW